MFTRKSLLSLLVCVCAGSPPATAVTIRYAKPDGLTTGSCLDWASACTMQRAISVASVIDSDQIWATKGTYKPVLCAGTNCVCTANCVAGSSAERNSSFIMKDRVKIYGGFDGWENELEMRDEDPDPYAADPLTDSILSGDLNGDDVGTDPTHPSRSENCKNIVRAVGTSRLARIDGFTIIGGYDSDTDGDSSGGAGIRIDDNRQVTIWKCAIINNYTRNGGGAIYCFTDSVSGGSNIVQTVIAGNVAEHGGAIGAKTRWSHRIFNCQIVGNRATGLGGAFFMAEGVGSPVIANTLIANNIAGEAGGGMYISAPGGSVVSILNCTMTGNHAPAGGGLDLSGSARFDLHNSVVWGNTADFSGAEIDAFYVTHQPSAMLCRC